MWRVLKTVSTCVIATRRRAPPCPGFLIWAVLSQSTKTIGRATRVIERPDITNRETATVACRVRMSDRARPETRSRSSHDEGLNNKLEITRRRKNSERNG